MNERSLTMGDFVKVQIFVSTNGDQSAGSREQPLRTLERAFDVAKTIEAEHENIISTVFVKAGCYWLRITQAKPR